ncbi:hypothetical protein HUW51_07260 [Adhaeribacter swui]|uniref:Efflux RND transporter periplasmic adaptor subunit n=1 Tax=Adhaeribacter swui TaxID=2086471 RepID=A0A7G7G5U9_9BACT|nr:hypothetical protein [Adhaeribacter swui]QNF32533.1 hypothetical protein HUW51_07260 [Adhaeribacter swui]
MKNIFTLLFLLLLLSQCQSAPGSKDETRAAKTQALVVVSTIQEKVYDQPSVKGLGIALVQPQETL